jgi:hypothetical protein
VGRTAIGVSSRFYRRNRASESFKRIRARVAVKKAVKCSKALDIILMCMYILHHDKDADTTSRRALP